MKKLLALLLLFTTLNLYASEAAKIVDVRGEVQILGSDGNSRKAQKDEFVDVEEVITTFKKSFIKLQFIDNSLTTLGPESELRVEVFSPEAPGVLNLVKGSLRSKVTKDYMKISPSSSKLFIKTKSASMGVRGTEFLWTYDPSMDQTGIVTIEGVVRFVRFNSGADSNTVDAKKLDELLNSKNAVTVTKGQGSYSHPKIDKGVAPSEDLPLDLMREIRRMDLTALRSKSIQSSLLSNNKRVVKNNINDKKVTSSSREQKIAVENGSSLSDSSRDLKNDNVFSNLTAQDNRSDVANSSIGQGQNYNDVTVNRNPSSDLSFPLKEELVSEVEKDEKDVEKEVNKKLKELERLQESEDIESMKAKVAKRKLEEQEMLSVGQREKNKENSSRAKMAKDLNEEALKRERLKGGYVPNLKEQEVRMSDLDLKNPKNALNEADGRLDAETEQQLAEQAKKSENDLASTTSVISGHLNKFTETISTAKDSVATIGAEVSDKSGSGSTSSGSGGDDSHSGTSLSENSGSGSTSSGSGSTSTLRKIASVVYNTLTNSTSNTSGDAVSDAEAEQKLKEEALKREYEACIIEYKKKNRLAPTAPMSAYLKRQQDAQAFCNEKVYGSGTDTTTTTDPASTGK